MKRIILSLCLLFPLLAWADDSGTTGKCTWYFEEATGTLTVSGNGQMGGGYNAYKSQIKNVVLEQGVTSIGVYAFQDCSSLASISIPEGVTSIGNDAFSRCSSLASITIPEGVTSIGDCAFYNCSSLASITIPEGVTSIGDNTFLGCSSLSSITIPEGVTSIGNAAFQSCSSLASITIPEGVTSIGSNAFYGCSSLTSITIPEGVTSIGDRAFGGCSNLTSITIPEGVTSIGDRAFYGCSSLTTINIPENLNKIGSKAFYECRNIIKIIIPNIEKWLNINFEDDEAHPTYYSNPDRTIYSDDNTVITEVIIPNGVININNYAFKGWSHLTSISIPEGVTSIGDAAFAGCSGLDSITIPEGVTSIGEYAFSGCLDSITIPESVTSIEPFAFDGCTYIVQNNPTLMPSLNYISSNAILYVPDEVVEEYRDAFPDNATQIIGKSHFGVTEISIDAISESSSALAEQIGENNLLNVTKLKLSGKINSYDMMIIRNKMVNLRELDMENVDIVANNYEYYSGYHSEDSVFGGYFFYNKPIRKVIFPKNITTIGPYAFSGSSISDIVFTGNDLKSIKNNAFSQCDGLESIVIPEGVEEIGSQAFGWTNNLYGDGIKEIKLPKSLNRIGDRLFRNCAMLTEIELPENINEIPEQTFYGCRRLIKVKLSPKTTYIGSQAFTGCSFSEFHLPPYLERVHNDAFSGCDNLKTIYAYMPDVPAIGTNTFPNYTSSQLYVPEFLYKSYYYDTNWSQFLSVKVCNLQPGDYEAFYANSDIYFEEGVERITEDTPEVELGEQGGIIVEGEEQHFDDVHQNVDGDGTGSSLIADGEDDGSNNNMPMNNLLVEIKVKANRWYFFCFPFDVTIADCEYPGKYAWREYDGLIRALQGSGGWKPVEGETLAARHGYIFQSNAAGKLIVKFSRPTFGGDRECPLTAHSSENKANASWNFIGNPYSSYYDFQEDDFHSPITVWNGTSYQAYRPGDDDYHLQPYEAFFVQKPEAEDKIGFSHERRETYTMSRKAKEGQAKARRNRGVNPDRLLVNISIAGENNEMDNARLVLNEKASRTYEMECDAAKFVSTEADAQLYLLEGSQMLAINERPLSGDICMGYMAKNAGTYRISASRMDIPVKLYDAQTGLSFDLSLGDYEFTTGAGTFNKRFKLSLSDDATAIRTLTQQTGVAIGLQDGGLSIGGAEGKDVRVFTTAGALVAQPSTDGFVSLNRGTYVVNVDGKSAKVYVK